MLKSFNRLTSSFAALLSDDDTVIDAGARLESVRYAMLDALMDLDDGSSVSKVESACIVVGRAAEVQTLWYLRSDVLAVLSEGLGEKAALLKMAEITEMFRGIVHSNQMPNAKRTLR